MWPQWGEITRDLRGMVTPKCWGSEINSFFLSSFKPTPVGPSQTQTCDPDSSELCWLSHILCCVIWEIRLCQCYPAIACITSRWVGEGDKNQIFPEPLTSSSVKQLSLIQKAAWVVNWMVGPSRFLMLGPFTKVLFQLEQKRLSEILILELNDSIQWHFSESFHLPTKTTNLCLAPSSLRYGVTSSYVGTSAMSYISLFLLSYMALLVFLSLLLSRKLLLNPTEDIGQKLNETIFIQTLKFCLYSKIFSNFFLSFDLHLNALLHCDHLWL